MHIIGIIPARYASSRFPAKALANIGGKSMIQRVYEQALKASRLSRIFVATDDNRIQEHVLDFGGEVIMTSPDHQSGTDRCFEALQKSGENADYVINIQGDEPFIQPAQINRLAEVLDGTIELATLIREIDNKETLFNPSTPKVVITKQQNVLYFSRQTLPYLRDSDPTDWLPAHTFYKHIGIYAYRSDILAEITRLPVSSLEKAEALEQLRWLENGYSIKAVITPEDSHGIDTPDDMVRISEKFL